MTAAEVHVRRALLVAALWAPAVALSGNVLEPHPSRNDNYGESFTFVADLEDGTYVWTQLSVTHLGPGSDMAACRALVVSPDKSSWAPSERFSKKDWWYDPNYQAFKVGHCVAREGEKPEVEAIFADGRLSLRFSKPLAPYSPPGTTINKGDSRYRASILLRNATVEATLGLPGTKPRVVRGGGYVDHSHSTWPPAKLARQWIRFRALRASPYSVLVGRETHDQSFGPLYLLEEGKQPRVFDSFAMSRTGGERSPEWRVLISGAASGKATLQTRELLYRSAPVENLGLLGNIVKPVVGSPVTYTYRASLQAEGCAAVPGIMEVTVDGG